MYTQTVRQPLDNFDLSSKSSASLSLSRCLSLPLKSYVGCRYCYAYFPFKDRFFGFKEDALCKAISEAAKKKKKKKF